jgi:putative endonuclease
MVHPCVPGAVRHEVTRRRPGTPVASMAESYFVYILANRYRGTIYVGVTNDLSRRISEHKSGVVAGFTKRYKTDRLVYCEEYSSILEARAREHVLKRWRREWKFDLVEAENPRWLDLSDLL